MICENCGKEHNGQFGCGRFCSKTCACKYSIKCANSKNYKVICKYCGQEFDNPRKLGGHIIRCKQNPNYEQNLKNCNNFNNFNNLNKNHNRKDLIPNICYCQYCGKQCYNLNSLKNHEVRCCQNPNRIIPGVTKYNEETHNGIRAATNQYIKAKQLGLLKPQFSEETKYKVN